MVLLLLFVFKRRPWIAMEKQLEMPGARYRKEPGWLGRAQSLAGRATGVGGQWAGIRDGAVHGVTLPLTRPWR